jgi:hypothetical protein
VQLPWFAYRRFQVDVSPTLTVPRGSGPCCKPRTDSPVGPRSTDSLPVDVPCDPALADSGVGSSFLNFWRGLLTALFVSLASWALIGISVWSAFS